MRLCAAVEGTAQVPGTSRNVEGKVCANCLNEKIQAGVPSSSL